MPPQSTHALPQEDNVSGYSLGNEGGLEEELAVRLILEPLLQGVHVLHSQNLIHGDIKPGSVLMNQALHTTIADFGLSIDSKFRPTNTRCAPHAVKLC